MKATEQTDQKDLSLEGQAQNSAYKLKSTLEALERELMLKALKESHGKKSRAARALGISERVMGIRVKQLGIDWRGMRKKRQQPTGSVCERCGSKIQHSPVPENIQGDSN